MVGSQRIGGRQPRPSCPRRRDAGEGCHVLPVVLTLTEQTPVPPRWRRPPRAGFNIPDSRSDIGIAIAITITATVRMRRPLDVFQGNVERVSRIAAPARMSATS